MKKKILLFTVTATMAYVMLQSNAAGPAAGSAGNRTGAKASTANCSTGGCHTGTTAPTAFIYVDSAGTPVTQYTVGKTYNVRIVGKHASLTKFGLQFATVSGADGSTSQVQAGTFASIASGLASHSASSLNIIEQTAAITATGDSVSKTFTWTAPSSGVGSITMYLTVNAVNGNGNTDATDASFNVKKVLTLYTPPSAVGNVANNVTVNAFPNPIVNTLNVQVSNVFSTYNVQVFDIAGRNVSNGTIDANATGNTTLNTSNWLPGIYNVVVSNENSREVIQVVKQ